MPGQEGVAGWWREWSAEAARPARKRGDVGRGGRPADGGQVRSARAVCAAVVDGLSLASQTPGLQGWMLHTSSSLLGLHTGAAPVLTSWMAWAGLPQHQLCFHPVLWAEVPMPHSPWEAHPTYTHICSQRPKLAARVRVASWSLACLAWVWGPQHASLAWTSHFPSFSSSVLGSRRSRRSRRA